MKLQIELLTVALLGSGAALAAPPALMDRKAEVALALSAGPVGVAEGAGVYVLGKTGYVQERESKNGFVCLVDHRVPKAVEPQCMDAEGVRTVLPRYLMIASLRAQGKPEAEIHKTVKAAYADGTLKAPEKFGVDYMLSTHNVVTIDEEKEIVQAFPPHVMFYALQMTNQDIGSRGPPDSPIFIVEEKQPTALIIAPVMTGGPAHHH